MIIGVVVMVVGGRWLHVRQGGLFCCIGVVVVEADVKS